MKKRGLSLVVALLTILAMVLGGCSSSSSAPTPAQGSDNKTASTPTNAAPKKQYTIKITHVLAESYHYTDGAKKFKELVEAKSNGQIKVEVYPNSQLGGERTVLEGLQMGTIEMGIISSGALSGFVPEFGVLDLGYLFRTKDEANKILNGAVGQELSQKMEGVGIRNLGFIDYDYRSVYGKKAITKPDDLKGIKIRVMENPAHQAIFRALGASPVPMAFPELYTGLQQGTVDAAENVPDVLFSSKQYEVAKQLSLTNHVYCVTMYMISDKFYKTLPADLQQLVNDSAKEAIKYEATVSQKSMAGIMDQLKQAGVTINEIKDLQPFNDVVMASWKDTVAKIPNGQTYLDKILKEEGRTVK